MAKDLLFIHGMFMNARSWNDWVAWFSSKGYRCHTLSWIGHEGEPSELRASPPEILRTLKLQDVVQQHRDFIAALGDKPLLIGHSVGGLITQILVNEGLVYAAAALDAAPPQHIFVANWSFLKSNLPVINPFAGSKPFQFTPKAFQYAFCNNMTLEEVQPVFEHLVCPESRPLARGVASKDAHIDFKKAHAPLLLIGGENDHIVPWQINKKTFDAYTDRDSPRELKVLPGRTHFLCGQPGWEETAEIVYEWLRRW
jgi:pimeloyl-ACP methyl ester carboxylesterase